MSLFLSRLRAHPSAVLLAVQLGSVLLYPFLRDTISGRLLLGAVSIVILTAAAWVVRRTPVLAGVALVLGGPALIFTVIEAFDPSADLIVILGAIFHAAFYFYASYAMIRYLFHDDLVTLDELYATAAAFTVVMWAFAYIFVLTETLWPGAFAPMPASNQFFESLFVSFTTLTGVGLSDIVPGNDQGRAVLMLGQLTGVMYVALVVSRLVGLAIMRRRD